MCSASAAGTHSPHEVQMSSETSSGKGELCPRTMLKDMLRFIRISVVFGGMSCFAIKPRTGWSLESAKWLFLIPMVLAQLKRATFERPTYAEESQVVGLPAQLI